MAVKELFDKDGNSTGMFIEIDLENDSPKASERLLSLEGKRLEVWGLSDGSVAVSYENAEVKNGSFLIAAFGAGKTFENACKDYFSQISGKTLVFNACSTKRQEIKVL